MGLLAPFFLEHQRIGIGSFRPACTAKRRAARRRTAQRTAAKHRHMTLKFELPSIYAGMKSSHERQFADHLEILRASGQIVQWRYECTKFKVGGKAQNGKQAWYTPDFDAITCEGEKVFYEVKGSWDMKNQRDAKTRIKVCSEKYPEYTWYGVTKAKGGGGWDFERFGV